MTTDEALKLIASALLEGDGLAIDALADEMEARGMADAAGLRARGYWLPDDLTLHFRLPGTDGDAVTVQVRRMLAEIDRRSDGRRAANLLRESVRLRRARGVPQ